MERRMNFERPKGTVVKAPRPGSLRDLALKALQRGATFEKVVEIVKQFDRRDGRKHHRSVEHRAYGLIRILHYQLGWGIRRTTRGGWKVY